jgi:hypothetical protein
VAQAFERVLAVVFGRNCVGSSPIIIIFLYVGPAVEHVLEVALGRKYGGSRPINSIFVYVPRHLNAC